jgi:SAM-dependent methyltransferase
MGAAMRGSTWWSFPQQRADVVREVSEMPPAPDLVEVSDEGTPPLHGYIRCAPGRLALADASVDGILVGAGQAWLREDRRAWRELGRVTRRGALLIARVPMAELGKLLGSVPRSDRRRWGLRRPDPPWRVERITLITSAPAEAAVHLRAGDGPGEPEIRAQGSRLDMDADFGRRIA